MYADDNAGYTDSPEDPSGTSTIRGQAHHIVVMPTIPGDGNTGTPVVQEEQHRPRKKKKSHKRHELAESIANQDSDASAAACAPSTAMSEGRFRKFAEKKTSRGHGNDFRLSTMGSEICKFMQSTLHQTQEPTDTVDGLRSEQVSHSPDAEVTNAFGTIRFDATSFYKPPYVRIHPFDRKDRLITLLSEHWRLPNAKIIVSVVGGSKSFQFDKARISSLFKRGLIDIATTTGAWILTAGSNTGVYEMIGSAVKEHLETAGSAAMNDIVLLGIASWGSVAERDKLVNDAGQGMNPAHYPILDITGGEGNHPLDPNHSHFILVDDGTRDQFGGEIKWRAAFEKFLTEYVISEQDGEEDVPVKVPIVKLLVNGDDGSLEACSKSLTEKMPLVAIAGSSGAAQVIVELHKFYTDPSQMKKKEKGNEEWSPKRRKLLKIYKSAMASEPSKKVLEWLTVIAKHCELISVFDFARHDTSSVGDLGLDKAILSAIYNNHDKCAMTEVDTIAKKKAEMMLALAWNRADYARDDILNRSNRYYKDFVAQKIFQSNLAVDALVDDMPEFMALFMEHGLDLNTFVTSDRLKTLYEKSMKKDDSFARIVKRYFEELPRKSNKVDCYACFKEVGPYPGYLEGVGRMIKKLLGYSYPNIYKENKKAAKPSKEYIGEFKDPAQHLFLWATLFNKMELAKMFWKYSQDHVAGAIDGSSILKSLAKASCDQEEAEAEAKYDISSKSFEELAIGILDLCWCKDRQCTSDMLIRISHKWGGSTVLSMAYNAEMEEFLAHPACYNKLKKIWRGHIALQTPRWRIYLFAVMPFMVFLLKFVHKKATDSRMDERQGDPKYIARLDKNDEDDTSLKPFVGVRCTSNNNDQIAFFKAMKMAFKSPIVKCIHYSLLFLSFLAVYSLFLMTELRPFTANTTGNGSSVDDSCGVCCPMSFSHIGCLEWATYVFALSMLLEEIRQVLFRDSRSIIYVKQKLLDWISDVWNQLDLVSYMSFTAAIILRFTLSVESFHWARIFFCFSLMVYFVRFSQIFYVVEQIGPKIIMIKNMMVDLVFFLVILSLTILAFGVICQSILYPQSPLGWALVNNVLYKPYFQMYGELFLEDFQDGYKWILLGLYMMLTNILLLNLLIAMFSYTFEKVQERSEILWKFNYYAVVYEHFDRPYIPLLGTLFQIIKKCYGCCSLREPQEDTDQEDTDQEDTDQEDTDQEDTDFRRSFAYEKNIKITDFVKVCMKKYVSQQAKLKSEGMTHKATHTSRRLELVIDQLEDLREDVNNQEANSTLSRQASITEDSRKTHKKAVQRLDRLESTLEAKFEALDNLKSQSESNLDGLEDVKSTLDQMKEMMRTILQQQSSPVQSSSVKAKA